MQTSDEGVFVEYTPSPINRLLTELSWCLPKAKAFRDGGRRDENVLTIHLLQSIDLLPRRFFAAVVRAAHGDAQTSLQRLASEAEDAWITALPNDPFLPLGKELSRGYPRVQPDGIVETKSTYLWLEAKAKGGSFQETQIAREYYCVTKAANGKNPLLLIITDEPPPFPIKKAGLLDVASAANTGLADLYGKHGSHPELLEDLVERRLSRLAWITWSEVKDIIRDELTHMRNAPTDVARAIERTARLAIDAIEWHCGSASIPPSSEDDALRTGAA